MISSNDNWELLKFSRHVPHILMKQTVACQAFNFMKKHPNSFSIEFSTSSYLSPSIERFWGALLFVDISGFTALSTKMNVDDLRVHINSYFEKIISIADKYDGQTVKFAGDALYIIWQAKVFDLPDDPYNNRDISKEVVLRAASCALEINHNCSNHKIVFPQTAPPPELDGAIHADQTMTEEVAYLNVHSGLSVGMMAGLDVGANDRWEFLLVGKPLADVAVAESEAKLGQLVISAAAHNILHPLDEHHEGDEATMHNNHNEINNGADSGSDGSNLLPCGCLRSQSGCFLVSSELSLGHHKRHEGRRSSLTDVITIYNRKLANSLQDEFMSVFTAWRSSMIEGSEDLSEEAEIPTEELQQMMVRGGSAKMPGITSTSESFSMYSTSTVLEYFKTWLISTTTANIIAHVHETAREEYDFVQMQQLSTFHDVVQRHFTLHNSSSFDLFSGGAIPKKSFVDQKRKMVKLSCSSSEITTRLSSTNNISTPAHMESDLTAELRNVIVLFIKIDINFTEWLNKENLQPSQIKMKDVNQMKVPSFSFLNRSHEELIADYMLLKKFQTCMDILTSIFSEKGGQLRQFIVDDKGTVCIGTFGLRGSVNYDDAAAAIEAAKSIIVQLRDAKMEAGIGITSGKAYCGLVGSPIRHEYAVMGPSVNLSARLMSKAQYLQILCDEETRKRDRLHVFKDLGEIRAKGYVHPVAIFSPVLPEVSDNMQGTPTQDPSSGPVHPTNNPKIRRKRVVRDSFLQENLRSSFNINDNTGVSLFGRNQEIDHLFKYLMRKVCTHTHANVITPVKSTHPHHHQINANASPIFVCIAGACGVGKSVFLNEICRKIAHVRVGNDPLDVEVFRKRITSYSSSEPFHAWRSVFREMMAVVYKERFVAREGVAMETSYLEQVLQGIHIMENVMPEQHRNGLISLLSSINFVPAETIVASELESLGPLSLLRAVDMLAAMLQEFVHLIKKIIFIAFDDLQWMDFYSWLLVQKLWSENQGVIVMSTFRTVNAGKAGRRSLNSNSFVNVQETFTDPERTLMLDLNPIEPHAIELLVSEVLVRSGFPTTNKQHLYEQIYSLSGGNPLYAYELIKVVVDQAQQQPANAAEDPTLCQFLRDFRSNRVEEVIYFRFDQLDSACQTVLKGSSVICAFGAPITFELLDYLINDDSNEADVIIAPMLQNARSNSNSGMSPRELMINTINITAVIRELLIHNEFISIVQDKRTNLDGNMIHVLLDTGHEGGLTLEQISMFDDNALREMHFEFSASIEQHAIYDLMLEDQKHWMHRRVAHYYEKMFASRRGRRGTPSELFECGLHLESAQYYHEAFPYFFRSAMILNNLGSSQLSHQQLERAHKIIKQMKSNLNFSASEKHSARGNKLMFDESKILNEPHVNVPTSNNRKSLFDITRALINQEEEANSITHLNQAEAYRMFQGRVDLLETAISVLLRLAQYKLATFQETNLATMYYEEAFHLITITLPDFNEVELKTNMPKRTSYINGRAYFADTSYENFHLQDYHLLFRALSSLIFLYRFGYLHDSVDCAKEAAAIDLFLNLSTSMKSCKGYALLAQCFRRNLLWGFHKMQQASVIMDRVKKEYSYFKYSKDILQVSSFDAVPSSMCLELQIAVLQGNIGRAESYVNYITGILPDITHVNTLLMVLMPLCTSLVFLDRADEAFVLFDEYYMCLNEDSNIQNQFIDMKYTFNEWLRLMKLAKSNGLLLRHNNDCHEVYLKGGTVNEAGNSTPTRNKHAQTKGGHAINYVCNKDILKQLFSPKSKHNLTRIRPVTHAACDYVGAGREYIAASVLYFHVVLSVKTGSSEFSTLSSFSAPSTNNAKPPGAKPDLKIITNTSSVSTTASTLYLPQSWDQYLCTALLYIDQSLNNTAVREHFFYSRIMSYLLKARILELQYKMRPGDRSLAEATAEHINAWMQQCYEVMKKKDTSFPMLVTQIELLRKEMGDISQIVLQSGNTTSESSPVPELQQLPTRQEPVDILYSASDMDLSITKLLEADEDLEQPDTPMKPKQL